MRKMMFTIVVLLSIFIYSCSKENQNKTLFSGDNPTPSGAIEINNYQDIYSSKDSPGDYNKLEWWPYIGYICTQPKGNCLPTIVVVANPSKSGDYGLFLKLQHSIKSDQTSDFFEDEKNWKPLFPNLYEPYLKGLANNDIVVKEERVSYVADECEYFYLGHKRNNEQKYDQTTVVFGMQFVIKEKD